MSLFHLALLFPLYYAIKATMEFARAKKDQATFESDEKTPSDSIRSGSQLGRVIALWFAVAVGFPLISVCIALFNQSDHICIFGRMISK